MKKILIVTVIGILLLSGISAVGLPNKNDLKELNISEKICFSNLLTDEKNGYQTLSLENTNSWCNIPNSPMIPAFIMTYKFPFGTKIKDVKVTFSDTSKKHLKKPIIPVSEPIILSDNYKKDTQLKMDENIYSSNELYPKENFYYSTHAGLDGLDHVIFLIIKCYPIRYKPVDNIVIYSDSLTIDVDYETPSNPKIITENFDLLIIYPKRFESDIINLADHKKSVGVNTTYKPVEEILDEYEGADAPEQIKYFIKDMIDNHNIKYVLLFGGLKSIIFALPRDDANQGTRDWFVPARYSNLYDGGQYYDPGYISDLYYADIYDGEGNFSSWDNNGDGIYAAWSKPGTSRDIIDSFPDVYVGRLSCRNIIEVKNLVKKIINYETGTDSSWFNKMVVIGGDTFDDIHGYNYYEGEVENQKALDYMTGFEPVKIWCSNRDSGGLVPVPKDILSTISKGCGFLFFAGHGSPERWNTYWCEDFEGERAKGLWWFFIPLLFNREKLPVCVVGGCHNSQFNVTATGFLRNSSLWVFGPVPECFSWLLTKKIGGGTIATLGNTGLGYGGTGNSGDLDGDGIDDPDCVEKLGGYIETQFFKAYGEEGIEILGEAWGKAVTKYLTVYPPNNYILDTKTAQQWALLGDPSLKIGGY